MKSRQKRIEKQRLRQRNKRREKQVNSARRAQQRLGTACPVYACMVNGNWRDEGKASILFARDIAPRRVTMAAFLVDTWAMGLKDAWGRTDIARSEFDHAVSRQRDELDGVPLNPGLARHLVHGGIELSRELGFRLPRKYERWTAVLGPLPEGESPDMGLFRVDGKIRLVCSDRDFRARLIGTTPESFLNRPDVEYYLGTDGFSLLDDDLDIAEDPSEMLVDAMVQRVTEWCFANGQRPSKLLRDAVGATLEAVAERLPQELDMEGDMESFGGEEEEVVSDRVMGFLAASFHHDPAGGEEAMQQVMSYMASTRSPEELLQDLDMVD